MRHAGIILTLLAALFLGVVASIITASADAPRLLTSHDLSTGPYNPNLPSENAIARGA
jgi:hypothetical protein